MSGNRGITVVDVIKSMGIETESTLCWSVGAQVREAYESRNGCLPEKDLRPKTNAGGSHCFAVYPEDWRETIERIVRAHVTEASRQQDLFK